MDSDCSSLTDESDSNDSDSLDFGSVTFKDDVAPQSEDNDDQDGEWDDDEFPPLDLNYEALTHIASCYLPGGHGNCVGIKELGRGDFNEIRLLEFEDGWSCIGRFARDPNETLAVLESEIATVKYVREHTTLPVPEVYFVNFDPTHVVGAPFMLMERMPGVSMYDIWDQIEEEHEVALIKQVADVLAELSKLQFDKIGSINIHGEVGELHSRAVAPREALSIAWQTTCAASCQTNQPPRQNSKPATRTSPNAFANSSPTKRTTQSTTPPSVSSTPTSTPRTSSSPGPTAPKQRQDSPAC